MRKTISCFIRITLIILLIYGVYTLSGKYYDATVGAVPNWLTQFMRMEMR